MIPVEKNSIPLECIISESMLGNQKMQQLLYAQFAPAMYSQCLRYTKSKADAEDLLQEGFIKIFRNLDKFRNEGSFEGWLKKIMFRTAVSHFRRTAKKTHTHQTELCQFIEDRETNVFDTLAQKDLVNIVFKLPTGYRTVFTMFVIEGYNHKEIAGILGCSEGSSKSQLSRSRTQLREMLLKSAC
jgi:RNA polymerase sigma factor (sigma-70 family)